MDMSCDLDISGIYAAMDTYDMAKVVRAAIIALEKASAIPSSLCDSKSAVDSLISRKMGNAHYKAGQFRLAVEFYNKALALAPKFSEEMILAYGNRSAVFYSIRYFSACLKDINTCLSMGCSEAMVEKLRRRRDDATPFMFEELAIQMMTNCEFVNAYLRFDCRRNADVPCASADVTIVTRDDAKRLTAGGDIRAGAVVAVERAFVAFPLASNSKYISCYYCKRLELCLYPCEGCCLALFCGKECQARCMKEYHYIECQILRSLGKIHETPTFVLAIRAAIKLSLKIGWDKFITASKDMGASRMRTATVKETFNSEEPLSILSYYEDRHLIEGKIFNGGVICACVLHYFSSLPSYYFPKETAKRVAAMDAMAGVMLHLYATFLNTVPIVSSAYDFKIRSFSSCAQVNLGWFSMSSKLRHSCEPNLLVLGLNDSVALVALRTIRRGEELTISYNGHFYESLPAPLRSNELGRATALYLQTRQMCNCRVCQNNWTSKSAVTVNMTKKQTELFDKLNANTKTLNFECFNTVCEALDTFPINSNQHKISYDAIRGMLNQVQSKYCKNITHS